MANEADKKQAQQLVTEALQQFLEVNSQHEKRQWVETHLPLMDQATKLDPDNEAAWKGRGLAKSELGDRHGAIADYTNALEINPENDVTFSLRGAEKYRIGEFEGAISDFREAIALNPKNAAAIRSLEAAEIALASHENAEKPQQEKEEYHKHLKERAEKHEKKFNSLLELRLLLFCYIKHIINAFIITFALFFLWYVFGGSDSAFRQAIGELNFFTLWPYYMFMFVSLMPSVVMLRLNIQDAKRELILKRGF